MILDRAAQKGTGKWTSQSALDLGVPLPLITESVFARVLSSLKDERVAASKQLAGPAAKAFGGDRKAFIDAVRSCAVSQQDRFLRAGFRPAARGLGRIRLEPRLRHHRADLARRLHHPRALPAGHHRRLRGRRRAGQPAAGAVLPRHRRELPGRAARGGGCRGQRRRAGAVLLLGHRLLRRLPQRAPAGQPDPGAARFLRRAHLRTHRSKGSFHAEWN